MLSGQIAGVAWLCGVEYVDYAQYRLSQKHGALCLLLASAQDDILGNF